MPLDKLRFQNILADQMNAPSAAAEELAAVVDAATDGFATQQQVTNLEVKMGARFDSLEAQLREQLWRAVVVVIGVLGVLGAAIIALLIAILTQI